MNNRICFLPCIMQMICHIKFTYFVLLLVGKVFFLYWRFPMIKKAWNIYCKLQIHKQLCTWTANVEIHLLSVWDLHIMMIFLKFKFPYSVSLYIFTFGYLTFLLFFPSMFKKKKNRNEDNIVRQDLRSSFRFFFWILHNISSY